MLYRTAERRRAHRSLDNFGRLIAKFILLCTLLVIDIEQISLQWIKVDIT